MKESILFIRDKLKYNDKTYTLGYNQITGLHYNLKNNIKKEFYNTYRDTIINLELGTIVKIKYNLYSNNNRRFDLLNIISIIDKFLLDLLVKEEIIVDDNINIISSYEINYMGVQKSLNTRLIEVIFITEE